MRWEYGMGAWNIKTIEQVGKTAALHMPYKQLVLEATVRRNGLIM